MRVYRRMSALVASSLAQEVCPIGRSGVDFPSGGSPSLGELVLSLTRMLPCAATRTRGKWSLGFLLRALRPMLLRRRVAGVSPLLSIGWWYLSWVSPKRNCCRVSAGDKGRWDYPLDPRPDTIIF
ncbi:uncharacterized protein TNCV_3247071 [Trichonephila clavipes]|nr:uncharacterized protein TNCV_3247071 [Trichonephila clavipes]